MTGPLVLRCEPAPVEDLLARFARSPESPAFYWERPSRGEALLALGEAARVEAAGERCLDALDASASRLFGSLRVEGDVPAELGPRLVGGFAFDALAGPGPRWRGFPPACLLLPRRLFVRCGEHAATVIARGAAVSDAAFAGASALPPGSAPAAAEAPAFLVRADRPPDHYRALVGEALDAVAVGYLEKVVVARSCSVTGPQRFDAAALLAALRPLHPECTLFAVRFGDATLVGATPELLVRLVGLRVETAALAGSAPRGRSPREDRAFARRLRESKKDQEEHAVVLRALREALAGCEEVIAAEAPGLLATEGIQHLHTPVLARLARPGATSVLGLAERLHPSPAVGGAPRSPALAWLRRHEGLDRGWYAGGVGWVTPQGEGAFAVPLRTALLRGCEAALFAGAGIVRGSDPEAELAETRLKLRAVLAALVEI